MPRDGMQRMIQEKYCIGIKRMKIYNHILAIVVYGIVLGISIPISNAQAVGAINGGEILRQIQPVKPTAPSGNQTGVAIPKQARKVIPVGIAFLVKHIRITGNSLFDTATLHALVADGEGKDLNVKQLNALAERITAYYRKHGYSLARAILPAQEISEGVVEIRVLEARYSKINLNDASRVRSGLLEATLSPLQSGEFIEAKTLDQSMLLLSDIPGIAANATLKAGDKVGTSDVDVNVRDLPMVIGQIFTNNFGNVVTGRVRGGVSLRLNNPLHLGDQLSFDGITTGKDVNFGRLGYELVLNGYGTRIGGDYSLLHYTLGNTLSNLNGHGTAQVASAWVKQPLQRSKTWNLYTRLQYNHKRLRDRIDASLIRSDRNLQSGEVNLSGDMRDHFISGAVSTWNVQWLSGRVNFKDVNAATTDASTARTAGNFTKWSARLFRSQALGQHIRLQVNLSGQWSKHNLDSVEKMVVGGSSGVRAYDVGVLSADSGYLAQIELGYQVTSSWQIFALFDNQHVRINNKPWAKGINSATLSGAGGGVRFNYGRWHAEAVVAKSVGSRSLLISDSSKARAWGQFSMGF